MTDVAISVRNVGKCFQVFGNQRARLLHALLPSRFKDMQEVWALRDVNFEIKRGESVAIIGRNGSGKSTLLEILTGTRTPTLGEVQVNGRVSALLELGAGFNPEFTGRDNVVLSGLLLGLSRSEILARFSEIEEFAEVGVAIDRPVKTYSSGMIVRLAFAVQVLCDPEILIIDEALSVGDFFFQQKCLGYIRELCAKGVTLLFVSHDMQVVRDLCSKGLVLEQGAVRFWGDNMTAVSQYLAIKFGAHEGDVGGANSAVPVVANAAHFNEFQWRNPNPPHGSALLAVGVFDPAGTPTYSVEIGNTLAFRIAFQDDVEPPSHVALTLRNRYNQVVTSFGTYTHDFTVPTRFVPSPIQIRMDVGFSIEAGEYSFQVNLGELASHAHGSVRDETPWLGPIHVHFEYDKRKPPFYGAFGLPLTISEESPS